MVPSRKMPRWESTNELQTSVSHTSVLPSQKSCSCSCQHCSFPCSVCLYLPEKNWQGFPSLLVPTKSGTSRTLFFFWSIQMMDEITFSESVFIYCFSFLFQTGLVWTTLGISGVYFLWCFLFLFRIGSCSPAGHTRTAFGLLQFSRGSRKPGNRTQNECGGRGQGLLHCNIRQQL